jgi:hypothetical protein
LPSSRPRRTLRPPGHSRDGRLRLRAQHPMRLGSRLGRPGRDRRPPGTAAARDLEDAEPLRRRSPRRKPRSKLRDSRARSPVGRPATSTSPPPRLRSALPTPGSARPSAQSWPGDIAAAQAPGRRRRGRGRARGCPLYEGRRRRAASAGRSSAGRRRLGARQLGRTSL